MSPERLRQLQLAGVERVETAGANTEPPERQIAVWGIHGASNYVTGIRFGDLLLERSPGEEVEALRLCAMRTVVPRLPPDALRDSKGKAVGYFVYDGLPPDFCRAAAERDAKL